MRKVRKKTARGFSLVELMVVVSIIGLLSTIVAINVLKKKETANAAKVKADIHVLEDAITMYHLDTNQFPGGLEDLIHGSVEGWHGPYIKGGMKALMDPWKRPYVYQPNGGQGDVPFLLGSYGMDGAPGGTGDSTDIFNNQQ